MSCDTYSVCVRAEFSGLAGLGSLRLGDDTSDDDMEDITEALRGLQELSRQILEEAKEDTELFG